MSEARPSFLRRLWEAFLTTWPLFAAFAVTLGFALWVYCLATERLQTSNGQATTRWHQFMSGEPNTMGDALAGFIGSLTLIWVIASVIQQSMELRAQRREFTEMVQAQEAQVKALNAQSDLLHQERLHREQDRLEQLLDQKVERLRSDLQNYIPKYCEWTRKQLDRSEHDEPWVRLNLLSHDDRIQLAKMIESDFFRSAGQRLNGNFLEIASKQEYIVTKPKASSLTRVVDLLDSIVAISDHLSDAQKQRIDNLRVVPIRNFFRTIQFGPLFDQETNRGAK